MEAIHPFDPDPWYQGVPSREEPAVVTYQYTCDVDGPTEVGLPMGTATATIPCPVCDEPARRVFSGPMLSTADQRVVGLLDRTGATSDTPEVVTSIPAAGRRRRQPTAPPDPRLQKLPRPR